MPVALSTALDRAFDAFAVGAGHDLVMAHVNDAAAVHARRAMSGIDDDALFHQLRGMARRLIEAAVTRTCVGRVALQRRLNDLTEWLDDAEIELDSALLFAASFRVTVDDGSGSDHTGMLLAARDGVREAAARSAGPLIDALDERTAGGPRPPDAAAAGAIAPAPDSSTL